MQHPTGLAPYAAAWRQQIKSSGDLGGGPSLIVASPWCSLCRSMKLEISFWFDQNRAPIRPLRTKYWRDLDQYPSSAMAPSVGYERLFQDSKRISTICRIVYQLCVDARASAREKKVAAITNDGQSLWRLCCRFHLHYHHHHLPGYNQHHAVFSFSFCLVRHGRLCIEQASW